MATVTTQKQTFCVKLDKQVTLKNILYMSIAHPHKIYLLKDMKLSIKMNTDVLLMLGSRNHPRYRYTCTSSPSSIPV